MPEHTPAPTPARSLYGFFLYLFSRTVFVAYCVWAFVPDQYLPSFNVYYYPLKYWSIAVPIQCLVALTIFAFLIYPSSNLMLTPRIDSINTICDPHTRYSIERHKKSSTMPKTCVCLDKDKCIKHSYFTTPTDLNENAVQHLHDLNIRIVCKKLYMHQLR